MVDCLYGSSMLPPLQQLLVLLCCCALASMRDPKWTLLNAYLYKQHKQCYETLPHDEPSCAATTFLRQATFLYPCTALTRAMQQPGRLCVHGRVSRARISAYMAMTLGFRCRINDTDFVHASSHQCHNPASASKKIKTIGEEA